MTPNQFMLRMLILACAVGNLVFLLEFEFTGKVPPWYGVIALVVIALMWAILFLVLPVSFWNKEMQWPKKRKPEFLDSGKE